MVVPPHARSNFPDRKLYVRFPRNLPKESEIKDLSPHIESVIFPRQKSARFCHIVVDSTDKVDEVLHELDKKPFGERGKLTVEKPKHSSNDNDSKPEKLNQNNGKNKPESITLLEKQMRKNMKKNNISVVKREKTKEDDHKRVFVKKIPESTTEEDLKVLLPGCVWVKLYKFKSTKNKCSALCKFSSYLLAKEFVDNPEKYAINGHVPIVAFANNQTLRGSKKGKKKGEGVDEKEENSSGEILKKKKVKKGSKNSTETDSLSKGDSDLDNEALEGSDENSDNKMEDDSDIENGDGSEDEDMSD